MVDGKNLRLLISSEFCGELLLEVRQKKLNNIAVISIVLNELFV